MVNNTNSNCSFNHFCENDSFFLRASFCMLTSGSDSPTVFPLVFLLTMSKVYNWFNERLEIQSIADDISSKYVPPHVNIFYCFGGIVLTCFLVQVATGFAMTFYYRPTVTEAFRSVEYIMTDVNFGWLIRSVHRWSASMMVMMMILHVFRVYLTGGFKKPRELTWVTGVLLATITVSFGVTGYSLPWDQVGYWAVKIVTGVPDAIPVVGSFVVELLRGGLKVASSAKNTPSS